MIADSRGRLETSLTGLPDDPDVADLEKYGFIPPAFMLDTAKTASTVTSAETQSDASGINEPASKSTDDGDANSTTTPARQSTAKPSTRATKSKGSNTGRAGSSKGGS